MSGNNSPRRSRSPEPASHAAKDFGFGEECLFPFPSWGPPPTMETILLHLPPLEEATVLFDSYYQNYTWK